MPILAVLGGAALALCGGGIVVAVVMSDTVVTSRAREALVDRGVVCDERFALDVDWSFSEVTIAPTRCQLVRLSFAESVELGEGATATLSGLSVTGLEVPSARVYLVAAPATPAVDLGPLGALGPIAGVGGRVGATGQAAAELAAHRPVPTHVGRIELLEGDTVSVRIEDVAVGGDTPTTLRAARATFGEMAGPMGTTATAELAAIEGTATPSTCHLEGDLTLAARVPILGAISHATHVVLDGSALDGPAPVFSAALGSR